MKKNYKHGAAFLAVCMFWTMGTTVFAAENTNLDQTNTSGNTTINATTKIASDPAYTVTIPPNIPVGNIGQTAVSTIKSTPFDVKAADVGNLNGKQVNVTVSTADASFNLTDKSSGNKLPYQLFNQETEGTALASGELFTSFTANGTVTGRVDIDQKNIVSAGEYTGILTFTIALADPI